MSEIESAMMESSKEDPPRELPDDIDNEEAAQVNACHGGRIVHQNPLLPL